MRIKQYFLMTDYSLWKVILNGDSPVPTRVVDGVLQPVASTTAEQKLARKNELKAHVILNGDSPGPTRVVDGVLQLVAPTTVEQKLARKNELKAHESNCKSWPPGSLYDRFQPSGRVTGAKAPVVSAAQELSGGYVAFGGNPKGGKISSKGKIKTEKAREEIDQQYVLFPVLSFGFTNPQNNDGDPAFVGKEHDFDAKKPKSEGNPQYALKDKGVIDSGCLRHMTWNMSYLSDFEELNGGYVAFGGNPKGGKISSKGKIKTSKSDFEDVYFIKELKFNLFSVSQMCDKKNKVLFTDTGCLVLSPDFKLPDESQRPTGNVNDHISKESGSYMLKRFNYVDPQGILKSNRVLVIKLHNKTPYELLIGRSPNLDFMRPFGCPVTILNTLDHQGKFEGKANEGFLVGYSVNRFKDLEHPEKVYKVVKALYGLHQAPRAWYETLENYLLQNGFQRGKIDQTLFIKKQKGDILLVQIYVDDIIFGATNKDLCKAFVKVMKDKFQMSSMGELTFLLGLQVKQKKDGIFISQDKYIAKI
nr:putative ribonuclease H-like domain-containing protein [Tanacetum cinerariifolium]